MEGITAVSEVAGLEITPGSDNTKRQCVGTDGTRRRQFIPRRGSWITDKWMQSKPARKDQWNTDDGARGAGRLAARITPRGERLFYFRYTDEQGTQWRYPLGAYDKDGVDGLTLAAAREEAGRLSKLYQSGVRDVRAYEETRKRNEAEHRRAAEEARKAAEARASCATSCALGRRGYRRR